MVVLSWIYGIVFFDEKFNMVIVKFFYKVFYWWGWVEVWVEFGCIFLGDCDESVLLFNFG